MRESLKTKDQSVAYARFAEFLVAGAKSAGRPAGLTVAVAIDDYVKEHVPSIAAPKEQIRMAGMLRAFFGNRLLKEIDIGASRGYCEHRRRNKVAGAHPAKDKGDDWVVSDTTLRRELNVLIAVANHAIKWRRMTPTDMPSIELPAPNKPKAIKWLTKAQVRMLFNACEGPVRDFCMIAYYTGARRRSIENLTRFQIDLKAGTINLLGRNDRVTKKRKPMVPIYPEIRPIIERLMASTKDERLFPRNGFYVRLRAAAVDVGIPGVVHPHMLRHSRATHMLMDGESLYKVARLLGDNPSTVEKVYAHCNVEFLATESNVGVG